MNFFKKNIFLFTLLIGFFKPVAAQDDSAVRQETSPTTDVENFYTQKSAISNADTFELRTVGKKAVDSLKKLDAFWYADSSFKKNQSNITNYIDSTGKGSEEETRTVRVRRKESQWLSMPLLVIILVIVFAAIVF